MNNKLIGEITAFDPFDKSLLKSKASKCSVLCFFVAMACFTINSFKNAVFDFAGDINMQISAMQVFLASIQVLVVFSKIF